MDVTITRAFDVEDASNSMAKIEHKVKRLQMNMEAPMMGAQTFDSEKESDMKGEGGKAAEKALKNKYSMTLDASGKITAVKADDNNPNKSGVKDSNDPMTNGLSQLGEGMDLPKVGDAIDFKILPDRAVSKGESWTVNGNKSKATYTLTDVTANEVIINYTEEATIERTQSMQGMDMTINSKDKTTGKIILDKQTNLLKEKTATTVSEGTMEMMGQTIPMNTKINKTVTIKGI
jgi:hypothetical protein